MVIKLFLPVCFILLMACDGISQLETDSKPISHDQWDELVKAHVHESGLVNYRGFIQDTPRLQEYLTLLANHHPNDQNWSREEQLAYWINAYNAFTVELVLKHYPVESIKDVVSGPNISFVNSPWDIKFINIEGEKYDLNNIEHGIMREKFNEPRIHFAINCASVSCPVMRKEAFKAEKLERQLHDQTHTFLNNPAKNKIGKKHIVISKVFKWFTDDFTENGSLVEYIDKHVETNIRDDAEVDYMTYNWKLNDIQKSN